MDYIDRIENISVLGAAGKMGSGILLLAALELTDQSLKPENKGKAFSLNAIDVSPKALEGLIKYVRTQAIKQAEKGIVQIRKLYAERPELIENTDVIHQYADDVVSIIKPTTRIEATFDSKLIFEAVSENPDLKIKLLSTINDNNGKIPWFFTNTSSIPIQELNDKAGLNGRIIGFHFYNPPAVQKLVELIKGQSTHSALHEFAFEYAKRLKKIVVSSNDVPGFIGNGHFMRDAKYGIQLADELAKNMPFPQAIYIINKITQEFLIRPMGIFQLTDYVGLDVVQFIMTVMRERLGDRRLQSDLLDKLVNAGIKGGQYANGSQKDGFLQYEKGKPVAVIDPNNNQYVKLDEFAAQADEKIGPAPASILSWKKAIKDPESKQKIKLYFQEMKSTDTPGAHLALKYAKNSLDIGLNLVEDNVAHTDEDVNTVLKTGFFHVYGPVNDFVN